MDRVAYTKDPHDMHLRELVSEAAAKAKLSMMPPEVLLPLERSMGLCEETVWSARCGMVGVLMWGWLLFAWARVACNANAGWGYAKRRAVRARLFGLGVQSGLDFAQQLAFGL